jgi:hypothetical protein
MFDETTETTEETKTDSCVPSVKQIATAMVLGASTVVFVQKAMLYRRLRKERLMANAQQKVQEPVAQTA